MTTIKSNQTELKPFNVKVTEHLTKYIPIEASNSAEAEQIAEEMYITGELIISEENLNLDEIGHSVTCIDDKGEPIKSWTNEDLFNALCNLSPIGQAMAVQALTQFSDAVVESSDELLAEADSPKWAFIHPQAWINAAKEIQNIHKQYQDSHK